MLCVSLELMFTNLVFSVCDNTKKGMRTQFFGKRSGVTHFLPTDL